MNVSDAMTKQLVVCLESDTAQSVAALMKTHDIGAVPVVSDLESKRLEGIVTDRDLCVRLVAENRSPETTRVGLLMTRHPVTCSPNDALAECERLMREAKIRRVPVVDQQGRCIGIVAQADIALHDTPDNVDQMLVGISKPRHGVFLAPGAVA